LNKITAEDDISTNEVPNYFNLKYSNSFQNIGAVKLQHLWGIKNK